MKIKKLLVLAMVASLGTISYAQETTDDQSTENEKTKISVEQAIDTGATATLNVLKIVGQAIGNSVDEANIGLEINEDGLSINAVTKGHVVSVDDIDIDGVFTGEGKLTVGSYIIDLSANLISTDDFITLNEFMVESLRISADLNDTVSFFASGPAYRAERIEEGDANYYSHDIAIAGLGFKVDLLLTKDGKVKLIIRANSELGFAFQSNGGADGYARGEISATLQIGKKLFITSYLNGKTGSSQITPILSGGLRLEHQTTENVSLFTGFNIEKVNNSINWSVPFGVRINLGN